MDTNSRQYLLVMCFLNKIIYIFFVKNKITTLKHIITIYVKSFRFYVRWLLESIESTFLCKMVLNSWELLLYCVYKEQAKYKLSYKTIAFSGYKIS